ncbi:MAG: beta-lactamase family protein [Bacteroidales bacterium]|nr:beta-lactamase family protein [Bacteroidales bacterium]
MKTRFFPFILAVATCLLISCETVQNNPELERTTPESQGVSSAGITDFMNAVDTSRTEIHSFMFLRHGKVIAEGWWAPHRPETKHIMFSASKTFAATGIGLALSENRLKLEDKVVSFFPASVPDTLSDFMNEMTVKDLLIMATGQDAEPRRGQNDDWIRSFLMKDPVDEPGTVFRYNNTATFMLSAIVQQVSGETLYDYLKPRIFDPLGMKNIDWDLNSQGINLGMIGLRLHTEDMAKFGQLLLQKGKWNGKQLIPEVWVAEATTKKIDSHGGNEKMPPETNDWVQGYCYQMWRCRNNGVRLDGLGGQFVLILPDQDAVIALTANAQNTQKELDLVWNHLLTAIKEEGPIAVDSVAYKAMLEKASSLAILPPEPAPVSSPFAERISGKPAEFDENNYGIKQLTLTFRNDDCLVTFKKDAGSQSFLAGLNSWRYSDSWLTSLLSPPRPPSQKSRDANYSILQPVTRVAASYCWTDDKTLELTARFVEETLGSEAVIFRFEEKQGTVIVSAERKQSRTGMPAPGMQGAPSPLKGKIMN